MGSEDKLHTFLILTQDRVVITFLLRRMVSSEMLRRVALVRTDVSEEPSASFIRVTRIIELGTILAATNNRRTLRISSQYASVASCS
jgi:hypothetical protein